VGERGGGDASRDRDDLLGAAAEQAERRIEQDRDPSLSV
jgi:hypothetical protein